MGDEGLQSGEAVRVIITGSRNANPFVARKLISDRLFELPVDSTIVHGGARGVDRMAGQEAQKLGLLVEEHPADWDRHGKSAGFVRNQEMLDTGADLVLAFWDGRSNGTRHTIEIAERAGIPVEVISL